ncbi:MAG: hypothetical protein ACE5HV_10255 [Acidobacteriota bacterium]
MIIIPTLDERTTELWKALIELAGERSQGWTLVGAQMVFLHALEHGEEPLRSSVDLDVVVNVRLMPKGIASFGRTLEELGYEFDGANVAGIGHRFVRGPVRIDLLAPDGLGEKTDVLTVAGARTVMVPGGSQALRRTELLEIGVGGNTGKVRRPNLLGAILLKARAVEVDDVPDDQREELCFLTSLIRDPIEMASELSSPEKRWLRRRQELLDPTHPAWRRIRAPEDGRLAMRILIGAE